MKKLLTILLLLLSFVVQAQTTNFSFTQIPYSDNDIPLSAGRGAEQWHDAYGVIPNNGIQPTDNYYRLQWNFIEKVTQNNYVWTNFDNLIKDCINTGKKFAFGIMTVYSGAGLENYDGARSAYPEYLHDLMQASGVPDWDAGNSWVPNYNHASYLARLRALYAAIRNHINSTSYTAQGGPHDGQVIDFADVIYYVEARACGEWGEWHMGSYGTWSSIANINGNNQRPTVATLKEIIKCAIDEFPAWPLVIPVAAFDGGMTGIPAFFPLPEVAHYALTATNATGLTIGIRRDQWGDRDGYLHNLMAGNTQTWAGSATFGSLILNKWRTSLVLGEPPGYTQGSFPYYADLENQLRTYHATSLGNGNFGYGGGVPQSQDQDLIRAAFKATGYRYQLAGGNCVVASNFTVNLAWQNVGIAPTYENWTVEYKLRSGSGAQVWTQNSSFNPRLMLPTTSPSTKTDAYSLPAIAAGTYKLYVTVKDPNNYRQPLPFATQGRQADGSYFLANVVFGSGPVNQLPTANAGANQSITTASTGLVGSGTDPDGTISTYAWSQVSGPSTAVIGSPSSSSTLVSSLINGTYTFNLTVTDNSGGTGSDQVQITRNTPVNPVANAGPNQTIFLTVTSQVTMAGSATDADGTIASVNWQKISGPAGQIITNPALATTTITNLQLGTYTFRFTATDNSGLTHFDDMTVIVNSGNSAPVANAGSNQTITLPTHTVSLSGSLSFDDGTIASYRWDKVGGPAGGTITAPNSMNTQVTNLPAGLHIYRLTVTDNQGLTHTDDVQITVNAAPNTAPVANAGPNQTITAPTASVTLTSAGSFDNNGITSRTWSKQSGPTLFTIVSPNGITTAVNNLVPGVYVFRVTVFDAGGLSSFDDVTVTVNAAPNTAPIANAGANQTIQLPTSTVSFSGSGSMDDNLVVSYQWSKVGTAGGTIVSPNSMNTDITGLPAGTHTYRLTVTDAQGLQSSDEVTVIVNPATNNRPVSIAGGNVTITLPTNFLTLNGSGSNDDNGVSSYQWSIVSGPNTFTIVSPTSANTNVINLKEGTYVFRLTVTDAAGLTDEDEVTVTVKPRPAFDISWLWRWIFKKR